MFKIDYSKERKMLDDFISKNYKKNNISEDENNEKS